MALVAFAACALWLGFAFTTWQDLANGPRFGSPWTTHGYGQSLLFGRSVQVLPIVAAVIWNLVAGLLGYRFVVRPLYGERQIALPIWLGIAGIIPGTLLLIAISRITTLVVSNAYAPMVIGMIAAGLTSVALIGFRHHLAGLWSKDLTPVLSVAAALAVALVFTVHVDRAHVVAEGSVWFITEVFLNPRHGIGSQGYWPLISQHYDEAAFLYPVIYGLVRPGDDASATLTAIYWIMLAFGRLGMVAVIYTAIRSFGVDRLSSTILVAFVCCASLSLNPVSSHVLFDSLSPLAYTLHVSRFLGAVLPVLLVAVMLATPRKLGVEWIVISAMIGVGLSSMTVHLAIVLCWAIVVAALATASANAAQSIRLWHVACATAVMTLVAFSVVYGMDVFSDAFRVALLLGVTVLAVVWLVGTAWLEKAGHGSSVATTAPLHLLVALSVGYVIGLVFLGNVAITVMQPVLSSVWPWSHSTVLERFYSTLASVTYAFVQSPYCDAGYTWGYRTLTGHCGSLASFARTYGLAPVIVTFVLGWRLAWAVPASGGYARTTIFWGMALSLLSLPVGFVLFDFVAAVGSAVEWQRSLSIWLRSRFVEPWFYGGIIFALALFLREASAQGRRWTQSALLLALALYALNPFVFPSQFIANFAYLIEALTGL